MRSLHHRADRHPSHSGLCGPRHSSDRRRKSARLHGGSQSHRHHRFRLAERSRRTTKSYSLFYYGLRGLSLIYLPFSFVSLYGLSLFAIFYGLDWLATLPPTVRLTAQFFGKENAGIMFGWLIVAHQLGSASAAFLAGVLRMDLGTYLEAFVLSGLMCLIAVLMVLFIGFNRKAPEHSTVAPAGV